MVFSFFVVAVTLFPDRAELVRRIKGVLAWRATYEPGETRASNFGYAVSYPDGEAVPGF